MNKPKCNVEMEPSAHHGVMFSPVSAQEVVESTERHLLPLFEQMSAAGGGPVILTKDQADAFVSFFKGQIQRAYGWNTKIEDVDGL